MNSKVIYSRCLLDGVLFHGAWYKKNIKKFDDAECIQLPQYDYDSDYPLLQRLGSQQYFTPYGNIPISVRTRSKSIIKIKIKYDRRG